MELQEHKNDSFIIIEIIGRLDTTTYGILEKRLSELIQEGQIKIVIDCGKMDYISSSGLRILLIALKKTALAKGKFLLCGLQENIKEIFDISGFTTIFEIYQTREEAVEERR